MTKPALVLAALLAMHPQEAGPLQRALNDMEPEGTWVYNDIPAGVESARKSGKPLLIVFRCVP
jgi:hypothetical protein